MTIASATEVRGNFSEILGRVAYGKERVTIQRRGRPLAALVPLADLERLENGCEQGPHATEDLLHALGAILPGILYRCSLHLDGRFSYDYLSSGLQDSFGLDPNVVMDSHEILTNTIHPEDRERRRQAMAESARTLGIYDIEYRSVTPQGEIKWLHAISRPRRHDDGVVTWTGVVLDITKWKHTQAALRDSEARLAAILDHAPVEIYLKDTEGRYLAVNRHYEKIGGKTNEEVRGKNGAEIFGDDAISEVSKTHDMAVLKCGRPIERDDVYEHRDGPRSMHIIKFPIRDEADRITGLGIIASDVTERKAAEEALRRRKDDFDLVADNLPVLISFVDSEGRFKYANKVYEDWYGIPQDEIVGSHMRDIIGETRYRSIEAELTQVLNGKRMRYESSVSFGKNLNRYTSAEWIPLTDENGVTDGFVALVQDITDRKDAEAALERARDELENRVAARTRELHATNRALEEEVEIRTQIEARLREGERDLLNLIEGSIQGVLIITKERKPRFANRTCAEIFGYDSPAEILDLESTLSLVDPSEFERLDAIRATQFSQDEAPEFYELDGVRKDGSTVRLQCMIRTMDWKGERVAQITLYDITERKRAEAALRDSREMLQAVVDAVPAIINAKDLESRYVLMNRFQAELFGVRAEDAVGQTADVLVSPEFGARTRARERQVIETGVALPYFEETLEIDRSSARNWLTTKVPLLDDANRVRNIVTVSLDITERKKAEEELARSEERLRQATELAGLGHCIWDSIERKCLFCSEDYARIHGVTPEEYIARTTHPDSEFIHPDDRDAYRQAILALRQGEPIEIEYRVITPEGEIRHVREAAKPIFDEAGALSQEICTIQDITERRLAEEMVRTHGSWLRAILEYAPLQIVLKDTEGQIMAISRNSGESLGVTMDEFPGRTTADFLPKSIAEKYMATDREVLATGQSIQQEVVENWEGTTRHFLNSKFPLRDDGGQIVGICSLTSDITEAKQAEERLRQAQKMEAVGQLTGGVAHDFNNILAVVLGHTELLRDQLGPENRQIAAVLRAATRGAELTQRLLAFSRRQPLKPQAIDLEAQISGMIEILTRTLGTTIKVTVAPTPGLWRPLADPGQLENALLNLAINARDAMANGGRLSISSVNVNLEAEDISTLLAGQALEAATGGPGDYVVLAVSDTGCGMSPAVLAHVFEPFFTTKGVGRGSGLGLSMVYGFARQSGGFAAIESAPGLGTTVQLYLPRAEATAPVFEARDRSGQARRGHGETVLLLEDAREVRELAIALLEDLGYRVLAAAEANEADTLLAENPQVDLLLTDVVLTGDRSGPDFAEIARQQNPALKVLFMSGYPAELLTQGTNNLDPDTLLLSKPFAKSTLANAVRDALEDRQAAHDSK